MLASFTQYQMLAVSSCPRMQQLPKISPLPLLLSSPLPLTLSNIALLRAKLLAIRDPPHKMSQYLKVPIYLTFIDY